MKKVVLSLVIGGLSISGDCFAAGNSFEEGSKRSSNTSLQQVNGTWSKVKVNTKKVLGNKKFQVAAVGTAAVIGAAVAAYYYSPSFAGLVNSNAKIITNYGSNASKVIKSYGSNAYAVIKNYGSNASKMIENYRSNAYAVIKNYKSNVAESIKSFLEIKPASTTWGNMLNSAKSFLGGKPAPIPALAPAPAPVPRVFIRNYILM